MLNISLVEDNTLLRESLVDVLAEEGFAIAAFPSVGSLTANSNLRGAQLFILDLNLPGEDGLSYARRLRRDHGAVGIIMLTARSEPMDRQNGYENGADIYLTKPSSPGELIAAIRALERRLAPDTPISAGVTLTLDPQSLIVTGDAGSTPLTTAEADLLRHFLAAPERRLHADHIPTIVGTAATRGAVEVRITRLRKKLVTAGAKGNPLAVLRGWGYQLTADITLA